MSIERGRIAKRIGFCAAAVLINTIFFASANAQGALKLAAVNGGEIEYEVTGNGEAVLMIHGSGVAATFAPQMSEPALRGYRLIRMHRRGFAGSARTPDPFTMKDHAADARALLRELGVERAHIVGHSFGGCVAMQLALDAPELVHSLVVMEAPIFNGLPASFERLLETYRTGDKEGAMSTFSQMSYGPEWRTLASSVPGGPEQVIRDADTVFTTEVPAMVYWGFGAEQAARISQPMVYVTGGAGRGASLAQLQGWMPRMESVVIPNVTHAMLMQDPPAVAAAIAAFLKRHPM